MAKTLKLATIEKRFENLHLVANFTEDLARAIAEHAQLLIHEDQTGSQQFTTMNMTEALNDWVDKFAPLASEMQRVEALYYATADGDKAQLIEEIPSTKGYAIPEPYMMTEQLCKIGYYEIEGDPYGVEGKNYTDAEIIANVQSMQNNLIFCLKALANATYKGVWEDAQKMTADIHDTFPGEAVGAFLASYNVI